jgi:hypothetical protein
MLSFSFANALSVGIDTSIGNGTMNLKYAGEGGKLSVSRNFVSNNVGIYLLSGDISEFYQFGIRFDVSKLNYEHGSIFQNHKDDIIVSYGLMYKFVMSSMEIGYILKPAIDVAYNFYTYTDTKSYTDDNKDLLGQGGSVMLEGVFSLTEDLYYAISVKYELVKWDNSSLKGDSEQTTVGITLNYDF